MKKNIFKLFLVFVLVIGLFVNNSNEVRAAGTEGFYICNGNDGYLQYRYDSEKGEFIKDLDKPGNLELNGIENLKIQLDNTSANDPRVILTLLDDVELSSCPGSPHNGDIISSVFPIQIIGNNHKLTFHCTQGEEGRYEATAFAIENYFEAQDLTIELYPEMAEDGSYKYCANKRDEYIGFEFDAKNADIKASARFNNTTIKSYTTHLIYADEYYEIVLDKSKFDVTLIQASPDNYGDASDFDEIFAICAEGTLYLKNRSLITVSADLKNKASSDDKIYEECYSSYPLIFVNKLQMDDSTLIENNKRNNVIAMLQAHNIQINHSYLELNGGVVGIRVNKYEEKENEITFDSGSELSPRNIEIKESNFKLLNLSSNIMYQPDEKTREMNENIVFEVANSSSSDNYLKIVGTGDKSPLKITEQCFNILDNTTVIIKTGKDVPVLVSDDPTKDISEYDKYSHGMPLTFKALVIPAKEPAKEIIRINTHGTEIIGYSDGDFDVEGDAEFDEFEPSYDEETNTFNVKVLKDFTFVKEADDEFDSFVKCQGVNLRVVGDKKLTFDYELNTNLPEGKSERFKLFNMDVDSGLALEGKSDKEKLKLVVNDNTSRKKQLNYNNVEAVMFNSFVVQKGPLSAKASLKDIELTNVDLQSKDVFASIFSTKTHNIHIIKSNIIYDYSPLNYTDGVSAESLSCILNFNDLEIDNSNIELDGDKTLKYADSSITSGAIVVMGDTTIKDCNGDNKVKVKGFNFGIGGMAINIDNTNLDVKGYRGGIVSYDTVSISLPSEDGYVKIKSDLQEELDPSEFDIDGAKYPAVYGASGVTITPPLYGKVYAYDLNNNVEEFKFENALSYRYVEIQDGNAPYDPTEFIEHFEGAPTKDDDGYYPYYEDEEGNYFEDPRGLKPIDDLEVWKESNIVPAISDENNKYGEIEVSPNQPITKPISSNEYTFVSNADVDKFVYVLVDGVPVSRMYFTVSGDPTIIKFTDEYLNSLGAGPHTIHIVSSDGHGYNTITIKKKSGGGGGGSTPSYDIPKTGIR